MRKWRVVGRIYGMKYSSKGHKDRNRDNNTVDVWSVGKDERRVLTRTRTSIGTRNG